jgi:hypothetical protein
MFTTINNVLHLQDVMREISAFLREGSPPVGLDRYSASLSNKSKSNSASSSGSSDNKDASPLETVFTGLSTQDASQNNSNSNNISVTNTPTETSSGPTGYAPKKVRPQVMYVLIY